MESNYRFFRNFQIRTVSPVPQNAINIILDTEKKAAKIVSDAASHAETLISQANAAGEASLREFELRRRADAERTVQTIRKSAEELLERSKREALLRAEEQRAAAEPEMHLAIKEIIKGIMELCR